MNFSPILQIHKSVSISHTKSHRQLDVVVSQRKRTLHSPGKKRKRTGRQSKPDRRWPRPMFLCVPNSSGIESLCPGLHGMFLGLGELTLVHTRRHLVLRGKVDFLATITHQPTYTLQVGCGWFVTYSEQLKQRRTLKSVLILFAGEGCG